MIKGRINGRKFKLKTLFEEVTLQDIKQGYTLFSIQSDNLKALMTGKEPKKEPTEMEALHFMVKWLNIYSDLDLETVENMSISGEGVSIESLFNECKKFLYYPKETIDVHKIKHNGKTYEIMEALKSIQGTEILIGNNSFKWFKLNSMLTTMINDSKDAGTIDALRQCCAVVFSNGDDSDEGIKQRVKEFEDLNALYAWSAWFFFVQLINKYSNFFQLYLSNPQQAELLKRKDSLKNALLRTTIGKFWKTKLQKWDYLT